MRPISLLFAPLLAVTLFAAPAVAEPAISDAVIRLPAASGRPAGGFATITAGTGDKADVLTSVSSPAAGRIELHSMASDNGVMRMRAEAGGLALPAGGTLTLGPGSRYHLMLFDVQAGLQAGETVPLTFTFQSGTKITAAAKLMAPGQPPAPGGHMHR